MAEESKEASALVVNEWLTENSIVVETALASAGSGAAYETSIVKRYLRANKFDATKTIDHISKNVKWRIENDVEGLMKLTPDEILGCPISEVMGVYPHYQTGYDKQGMISNTHFL